MASRGKSLERRVAATNRKYYKADLGFGWQNPTGVNITKSGAKLTKSIVDFCFLQKEYVGCNLVAFDCKETKSKTSFAFSAVAPHQLVFLREIEDKGGSGFVLVHPYELNTDKGYLIPIYEIDNALEAGKKSIKFKDLDYARVPLDDYLELL